MIVHVLYNDGNKTLRNEQNPSSSAASEHVFSFILWEQNNSLLTIWKNIKIKPVKSALKLEDTPELFLRDIATLNHYLVFIQ